MDTDKIKITIEPLTSWKLVCDLARETVWQQPLPEGKKPSDDFIRRILTAEHSPIRAKMYRIRMEGIPYFLSVHLVRHKIGVEHFVSSQRSDRTGVQRDGARQDVPVNHTMVLNAQAVMTISRKRLCNKAAPEMRKLWNAVRDTMNAEDRMMAEFMVPQCYYTGGVCHEMNPCGKCGCE